MQHYPSYAATDGKAESPGISPSSVPHGCRYVLAPPK
jgi:hypothetical protein